MAKPKSRNPVLPIAPIRKGGVEATVIKPRIMIMVDRNTTDAQAKKLRDRLEEIYSQSFDDGDEDSLYEALKNVLDGAELSGDYNIDPPEFAIYIDNKTQIA